MIVRMTILPQGASRSAPMPRIAPDRAALEVAHIKLRDAMPLDVMLQNPTLKIVLETVARRHMQRRDRVDYKKLQANDLD